MGRRVAALEGRAAGLRLTGTLQTRALRTRFAILALKPRAGTARLSYYAGVSSDRTNLSPFTKDYRGLALQCD